MSSSSRTNAQLSVGPMELRKSELERDGFRKSEPLEGEFRESEQVAALVIDEAFTLAGLQNKEIAHLCGISVSLVEKWRKPDVKGCPSFAQMLRLPPAFHIALHRVLNRRYGFGRAALGRVLDALGDLAFVGEL